MVMILERDVWRIGVSNKANPDSTKQTNQPMKKLPIFKTKSRNKCCGPMLKNMLKL